MEIAIMICLLIVIVLLMQDKIVIPEKTYQKQKQDKMNPNLPDVMGQAKQVKSHLVPNTANESIIREPEINLDNSDVEYDENESAGMQILQEEPDQVFSNMPDWEEEEQEWNRYGISGGDISFAQGVTYEELSSVGAMIQKEHLGQDQKETAVAIVQKLQGTELFSLLENSMEGASRRIAALLDSTPSGETDAGTSTLQKNNFSDFDIGEFV